MAPHRLSYVKTLGIAASVGLSLFLITRFIAAGRSGIVWTLIVVVEWSATLVLVCVVMGAVTVLYRDQLRARGRIDLFDAANDHRSARALATGNPDVGILLRRTCRRILRGRGLLVGDIVTIRSLEEIQTTLDGSGCLDGLPFMTEMAGLCGQQALVFRRVDKIYDYGRTKKLRRLERAVLLSGLRCDGSAHGGCQASCYLLWKEAWLRPAGKATAPLSRLPVLASKPWCDGTARTGGYTCQYTQLAAASTPMTTWDIRQDLRPILAGNVTVGAFCVAILTRLFNAAQGFRGGAGHPSWELRTGRSVQPIAQSLAPGDTVRVLAMKNIAPTLNNKGRNRGLWFDRDMIRHCGRRYVVLRRVDRIIDDATGQMRELKTPGLTLDGAEASGEFLRFCAQHEYPLWREVWLSRELDEGAYATSSLERANPVQPMRSFRQWNASA
jgi:hypothetical protein